MIHSPASRLDIHRASCAHKAAVRVFDNVCWSDNVQHRQDSIRTTRIQSNALIKQRVTPTPREQLTIASEIRFAPLTLRDAIDASFRQPIPIFPVFENTKARESFLALLAIPHSVWWNDILSDELVFKRKVDALGKLAGSKARGKHGKVSNTSVEEAEAAARCAVIQSLAIGGVFSIHLAKRTKQAVRQITRGKKAIKLADGTTENVPNVFNVPATVTSALRRIAIKAGTKSLFTDLVCGQKARKSELQNIRRELFAVLEAIPIEASPDLSLPRLRAVRLVRAVRAVRASKLASIPRVNGWQGAFALTLRRFRRIARVLSMVAQDESLAVSVERAGFKWDAIKQASSGWQQAYEASGVKSALTAFRK